LVYVPTAIAKVLELTEIEPRFGPPGGLSMKGSYESHLPRLEKAFGGEETPVLMVALIDVVNIPSEPIAGWRDNDDLDCPRAPFESDEHFAERAKKVKRGLGPDRTIPG
jgi:hypothetical protein